MRHTGRWGFELGVAFSVCALRGYRVNHFKGEPAYPTDRKRVYSLARFHQTLSHGFGPLTNHHDTANHTIPAKTIMISFMSLSSSVFGLNMRPRELPTTAPDFLLTTGLR